MSVKCSRTEDGQALCYTLFKHNYLQIENEVCEISPSWINWIMYNPSVRDETSILDFAGHSETNSPLRLKIRTTAPGEMGCAIVISLQAGLGYNVNADSALGSSIEVGIR